MQATMQYIATIVRIGVSGKPGHDRYTIDVQRPVVTAIDLSTGYLLVGKPAEVVTVYCDATSPADAQAYGNGYAACLNDQASKPAVW